MDITEANITDTNNDVAPVEADRNIVLAELQRVMQNRRFSSAPQMSSFLKYIVEQTLDGHGDRIKAYSVGVDALGKPPSFDAQSDPSVRVLALRLRKTLAELYQSDEAPIANIVLNVGSYAPEFYQVEKVIEPERLVHDDLANQRPSYAKVISPNTMVGERHPSRDEALISDGRSANAKRSSFSHSPLKYKYSGVGLALLTCAVWLWGTNTQATGGTTAPNLIFKSSVAPSLNIDTTVVQSGQVKEVASLMTNSLLNSSKFTIRTSASDPSSVSDNTRSYRLVFSEFLIDGQPRIDTQVVHADSGVILFSRPLLFDTNLSEFSLAEMNEISDLVSSISMVLSPLYDDFYEKSLLSGPCDS